MFIIRLLRLMYRELTIVWSDWRLTVIVFTVPFFYTALLGYLYIDKRVADIPTVIIDHDHSALSRAIVTAAETSEAFRVIGYVNSVDEFESAVLKRKAFAAIWVPKNFERDIKKGRQVKLLTLMDGSNMLLANTIMKGSARLAGTYSAGVQIKKLNMKGTPYDHALPATMPVDGPMRVGYNPTFNYWAFIYLGLLGAVAQQVCLLGCAISYAKERQHGLVPTVFKITNSALEVLTAKALLYTVVNTFTTFGAYWLGMRMGGIKLNGSMSLFILVIFTFVFMITALGICVSALCKDETFATEVLMLLSLPSFLLSGFTWPVFSMKPLVQVISWVFPLTHFVMPLRTVGMQNGGFADIRADMIWMWTLATISYLVAYVVIWRVMVAARQSAPEPAHIQAASLDPGPTPAA